ncbi:MAG: carboxypeptidase-like regulatory domain-containing protein, partial [Saprospiraceae bacterium]
MKQIYKILIFNSLWIVLASPLLQAQTTLRGKVLDDVSGEALIGATVAVIEGGTGGGTTNYDGEFSVKVDSLPAKLSISYTGYATKELDINSAASRPTVRMASSDIIIEEAIVRGQRVDDKQKSGPLTVENMDAIAIKETPAVSFYNGLGNLKGVDLTTASLGFTVINMRGFNSTSPVRSLQIIDGVDNQAPGLNFSLGNFLGASELDVNKVDLVAGASGPFYGPNAFNGVISIESKNPFIHKGLSVLAKGGERDLFEGAIRWAQALKDKKGQDFFAYKLNFYHLRAHDWEADNYDPVNGTLTGKDNPGGYDAVNRYGDEYNVGFNSTGDSPWASAYGLGIYHRTGYREIDLVDYDTRNYKANAALHFRLRPGQEFESPELILSSSFGSGTTVYQGDNRFSLRNILFFQNRLELRKTDHYFLRFYATNENAGDSYDPYATALRLQTNAKSDQIWKTDYTQYWIQVAQYDKRMQALGYPKLVTNIDPVTGEVTASFDYAAATQWFQDYRDTLFVWHDLAAAWANEKSRLPEVVSENFYEPGTPEFKKEFDRLTHTKSGPDGGTLFFDKSALYHGHGEYRFHPRWASYWAVGANARFYRPVSEGTIFSDTLINGQYRKITNNEMGAYTGLEKKVLNDHIILTGTVRADKNQNFDLLFTPAASLVYTPNQKNYLRFSFSSAIRNPTLTDQYLFLDVGRATLLGNLHGFDSLITVESFQEGLRNPVAVDVNKFKYFNVA